MQQALFDIAPAPGRKPLAGLARLAAQSVPLQEKREIEYLALPARSILNRCASKRMPFEYTINPYRGCEFGCKYCYARYTHEYLALDGAEFEKCIYVKEHAAGLLAAELKRTAPSEIAIGTATDPYQPAERRFLVTRALLGVLAKQARGFRVSLVTKSDLVTRDLDLFLQIAGRNLLSVNLTVTTLDERLARALEPRAPLPGPRLAALERLAAAGLCAGVFAAPVLPAITDSLRALEAIARESVARGARHFLVHPLFLPPCAQEQLFPVLEKEFPELVEPYRRRYERGAFLCGGYVRRLQELAGRLRERYNLSAHPHGYAPGALQYPFQGSLF